MQNSVTIDIILICLVFCNPLKNTVIYQTIITIL